MRISRQRELNRIRSDKKALASYVEEKEAGVIQLEKIIKKVLKHYEENYHGLLKEELLQNLEDNGIQN